jgi:serine protease AprX
MPIFKPLSFSMKQLLVLFCCSFLFLCSHAQYNKYVIQLKDKQQNTFTTNNPSAYLSAKSLARRSKQNINIDTTDLPITQRYVDSIRLSGNLVILSVSKWLNRVLIQTSDANALNKINSFPFVVSAGAVGFRTSNSNRIVANKFDQEINLPAETNSTTIAQSVDDYFNYGNSNTQIAMHDGQFLHNKGFRGENMLIAVFDAGFSSWSSIPAFDSVRINNQVIVQKDFVAFDNSVIEDDAHGMRCFSIIAANQPGLLVGSCPKAKFVLARTENVYTEYPIEEFNWAVGAELADSLGCDMISSSLGYTDFDDPQFDHTYAQLQQGNTTTVARAANMAHRKGMLVLNSAGNSGSSAWRYLGTPADGDSVVAVGSVTSTGNISSFSSYGFAGIGKIKPNIVSMGTGTYHAGFGTQPGSGNGTSYSTPNVAGLIACLWQAFPQNRNSSIMQAVYASADRFANPDSTRFGYGIPNFKKAYRILKVQQNAIVFGPDWMKANPNPFEDTIRVDFIGQVDGNMKLELINPNGSVIATQNFSTEKEEIYLHRFTALKNISGGDYTVRYTDSLRTRSFVLNKKANQFEKDWMVVFPNPFVSELNVYVKAPETAEVFVNITDAKGSIIATQTKAIVKDNVYTFRFPSLGINSAGVYNVQFASPNFVKVKRILRK